MFDILSKLGEIKEKSSQLKSKIDQQSFLVTDSRNSISLKVNGKKDITEFQILDNFYTLSKTEQEIAIKEALQNGLSQSESFITNELKGMIPNIPGLNIFG